MFHVCFCLYLFILLLGAWALCFVCYSSVGGMLFGVSGLIIIITNTPRTGHFGAVMALLLVCLLVYSCYPIIN